VSGKLGGNRQTCRKTCVGGDDCTILWKEVLLTTRNGRKIPTKSLVRQIDNPWQAVVIPPWSKEGQSLGEGKKRRPSQGGMDGHMRT